MEAKTHAFRAGDKVTLRPPQSRAESFDLGVFTHQPKQGEVHCVKSCAVRDGEALIELAGIGMKWTARRRAWFRAQFFQPVGALPALLIS